MGEAQHCHRGMGRAQGGFQVMKSRRKFLMNFAMVGASTSVLTFLSDPQVPGSRPQNPQQQRDKDDDANMPKPDPKMMLAANEKEIKKNVEKLYELASELKTEVEKTDSVKVLSLSMLKKAEEIERLAKEIRSRAKG